jgi:hypothetical protein
MKTESEVKSRVTPEIIKEMCELAEGFEYTSDDYAIYNNTYDADTDILPILIHRAVEGWNKLDNESVIVILDDSLMFSKLEKDEVYYYSKNYQTKNLTQLECALLDCLVDVLEEI